MATIAAELALEVAKFQNALRTARSQVGGFKANLKTQGGGLGTALFGGLEVAAKAASTAAVATVGAAVAAIVAGSAGLKQAFDLGGSLSDTAARIGSTAGNAQLLSEAFKRAGIEAGSVDSVIAKMQKNIAEGLKSPSGDQASLLRKLGLDPKDLANMDSVSAFEKIGRAIAGIQNPTVRTAAAMELFGKSGFQLLNLFRDGGAFEGAKRGLGEQSRILTQRAADFDKVSDVLGSAYNKLQGFFVGLGAKLVDYLMPVIDWFDGLDLAVYGQMFGDAIANALKAARAIWETFDWATGLEVVGAGLSLAFKSALNFLWARMWGEIRAWGQYVQEAFKTFATYLSVVTTSEFWSGMWHALLGIAARFNQAMADGIAHVLEEAKKIPGVGKLIGNADKTARQFADASGGIAAEHEAQARANLKPAFDAIAARWMEAVRNIFDAYKRGYGEAGNRFNTTGEAKVIADWMKAIAEKMQAYGGGSAATKSSEEQPGSGLGSSVESTALAGGFASAVNLLMGRSPNELILDKLDQLNKYAEETARNTRRWKSGPAPREAKPIDMTPRFA